jgi:hypothetical protein
MDHLASNHLFFLPFLSAKMIPVFGNRKNAAGNKLYFLGNRVGPATYCGYNFKFPAMPLFEKLAQKINLPWGDEEPSRQYSKYLNFPANFLLGEKMAPKYN